MNNEDLAKKLLKILYSAYEPRLGPGDSILVQPEIEGQTVENKISISGYNYDQIDNGLRLLCREGFITTGGPSIDAAAIGVYFGGITHKGKVLIGI
jgi:hypothetical protein